MDKIEFPLAVFGGVFANIPVIENIISICDKYNVKTSVSFGNTVSLGDPDKTFTLINENISFVVSNGVEEYCNLPYDLNPFGMKTYWYGLTWTKNYLKTKQVPFWFSNVKRELSIQDFVFSTYEEKKSKDFSNFRYLFLHGENFKIKVVNKNGQSIFYIPHLMFINVMGEFIIIEKDCFHIFSIPVFLDYSLSWCQKNIHNEVKDLLKRLEKYNHQIKYSENRVQTFKYSEMYCESDFEI